MKRIEIICLIHINTNINTNTSTNIIVVVAVAVVVVLLVMLLLFLFCVEQTGTGVAHWIGHKHHSKRLQRRGARRRPCFGLAVFKSGPRSAVPVESETEESLERRACGRTRRRGTAGGALAAWRGHPAAREPARAPARAPNAAPPPAARATPPRQAQVPNAHTQAGARGAPPTWTCRRCPASDLDLDPT